jgi:hypothetical protein
MSVARANSDAAVAALLDCRGEKKDAADGDDDN